MVTKRNGFVGIFVLGVILFACVRQVEGEDVLITFSEFPLGTSITDQYANLGIIFGGDTPYILWEGSHSAPPVLSGTPQLEGAIEGYFVSAGGDPMEILGFAMDAGWCNEIGSIHLEWFDLDGNWLGETFNSTLGIVHFVVAERGIASWRISQASEDPAGYAIDNVSFDRGCLLELSKTHDVTGCVSPDDTITYAITCEYPDGTGPDQLTNATLVDRLPGGVDFVSASAPWSYNPVARTVTWNIGTMAKGDSPRSFTLTVRVNSLATQYSHLHNVAKLWGDNGSMRVSDDTPVCHSPNGVVYVDWDAAPGGDGTSWLKAYRHLQDGLDRAANVNSKTVWVAQGTYKPGDSADDSFVVPASVKIYGGFRGIEAPTFDPNLRDLDKVKTVLSGRIGWVARSNKVVTMGNNSLLNGCVVEGGGPFGGVYGMNVNLAIERCEVQGNSEDGIRVINVNATVNWCRIHDNGYNGIYVNNQAAPSKTLSVNTCRISHNYRNGIFAQNCTPTIKNSVVNQNGDGPVPSGLGPWCGIRLDGAVGSPLIRNCTIVHNIDMGIYRIGGSVPQVRNSILWDNNVGGNGSQHWGGLNVWYSCVMNRLDDPNNCIHSDPMLAYTDPNVMYHLRPGSPCIDRGDPSNTLYTGETDIDGQQWGRIFNGRVDIGADEFTCDDVCHIRDWNQDGALDMGELRIFARAWLSNGDPNDPNSAPRWDSRADLVVNDFINLPDFSVFAQPWPWRACWRELTPVWPTLEVCIDPNIIYEPNEPWYDPNEPWDPNDPNSFGMMGMSMSFGEEQVSLSAESSTVEVPDPELTIQQLEETIDFLYEVADEVPEETDNIMEMIKSLQDELDLICETRSLYEFTQ